jgi:hypothetical protein
MHKRIAFRFICHDDELLRCLIGSCFCVLTCLFSPNAQRESTPELSLGSSLAHRSDCHHQRDNRNGDQVFVSRIVMSKLEAHSSLASNDSSGFPLEISSGMLLNAGGAPVVSKDFWATDT